MLARIKRFYQRLKRNWVIAMLSGLLISGAAVLTAATNVRENLQKLLFPPPSALEVVDRQSKQEISREFIRVTWRRLYRSNQFIARIRRGASDEEIDSSWRALLESVEEMASKTMIFAIGLGELYGDEVRAEYESVIQVDFADVTTKIVDLRYQIKRHEIEGEELKCTLSKLARDLENTNFKLYQFSSCFDRRLRTPTGCLGDRNVGTRIEFSADCSKSG